MKQYKINYRLIVLVPLVVLISLWSCDNKDYEALRLPDSIKQLTVNPLISTEGFVGDELVITGTNFSPLTSNNKVLFNGVAAIVKSASETELVIEIPQVVPRGEVTTSTTITISHGQFLADVGTFTVSKPVVTLVVPLTDGNDDVEEVAEVDDDPDPGIVQGSMVLDSGDLELGEISSGEGLMNIGIRYNNVTIPQQSIIKEAYVQFNADDTGSDPVELTIYGENVGNAAPYLSEVGNLSSRALTTASVVWNVPEWVEKGDRGDAQKTVNIASIIQEIVNRDDWVSGNSINIIMKHTGVSVGVTSSSGGREAEDFSSSTPEHGAELSVVYN